MRRPRTVLCLVVVATVALAGCLGGAPSGTAATTTPTTTDATATPTTTGDGPTADDVRDAAIAAIDDVETYAFEGRMVQTYRASVEQTSTVNTTGVVDRADRRLRVNQTQSSGGRTYAVATYVVNDTVYSKSDFYTQDYGSKWIARSPANFSDYWNTVDVLTRQRAVLSMANVSLGGTETIDGTETRVLNATVPAAEYRRLANRTIGGGSAGVTGVDDARFRFWVATDTHRLVRSNATLDLTLTVGGTNASVSQTITIDYSGYGDAVNVTLPNSGRKNAVNVSARSG